MTRQATGEEKIFTNHISDKDLNLEIENLWKLDDKANNPIKKKIVLFKNAKILKDRMTETRQLSDPEDAGAEGNYP